MLRVRVTGLRVRFNYNPHYITRVRVTGLRGFTEGPCMPHTPPPMYRVTGLRGFSAKHCTTKLMVP